MNSERRARERGANLVEAAIIIPLLLMLLATVVDFGRAYFAYITIINAAREGARYGVSHATDTTGICAKVLQEARDQTPPVDLTCANVTIANSPASSGLPIRVTVTHNFPVILGGILGRPTIPISYGVSFRIR